MTVCNMSIEGGARAGLIAPDDTTFAYLEGRPSAPKGEAWEQALDYWRSLPTDPDAEFDKRVTLRGESIEPFVTWGMTPAQSVPVDRPRPGPVSFADPGTRELARRALVYMGLEPRTAIEDIPLDRVFIGSCTNSRIEDLRAAAAVVRGQKVAPHAAGDGGARLRPRQGPGREGRPRQGLPRRGLRVARRRLLDVPGHEPGHPAAGRALRVDVEPQLRGPSGTGRPYPPGESGDGGGGGDRRPLRRHPRGS